MKPFSQMLCRYLLGDVLTEAGNAEKNKPYPQEKHGHGARYGPRLYRVGTVGDHKKHIEESQYSGDNENNLGSE